VSFAAITLCVASQRVFIVVYFAMDSVRKLLDTPSYKQVCMNVRGTRVSGGFVSMSAFSAADCCGLPFGLDPRRNSERTLRPPAWRTVAAAKREA
jgi:hypothetical protein